MQFTPKRNYRLNSELRKVGELPPTISCRGMGTHAARLQTFFDSSVSIIPRAKLKVWGRESSLNADWTDQSFCMTELRNTSGTAALRNPYSEQQARMAQLKKDDPDNLKQYQLIRELQDRLRMSIAASTPDPVAYRAALMARGTPVTIKKIVSAEPAVQISPQARNLEYRAYLKTMANSPANLEALDVNAVVDQNDQIGMSDIIYYAKFVEYYERKNKDNPNGYSFVGSYGTDKVTNNVNEYIGWLYDAAGKKKSNIGI